MKTIRWILAFVVSIISFAFLVDSIYNILNLNFPEAILGFFIALVSAYWPINVFTNNRFSFKRNFRSTQSVFSKEEFDNEFERKFNESKIVNKLRYKYNHPITKNYQLVKYDTEFPGNYVVLDFETTGFQHQTDRIIEYSCIKCKDFEIIDSISSLIDPEVIIPEKITKLTGINNSMTNGMPKIYEKIDELVSFIGENTVIAHNVKFDIEFLLVAVLGKYYDYEPKFAILDTVDYARKYFPGLENYKLKTLKSHLNINGNSHRSYSDAAATNELYKKCHIMQKNKEEISDFAQLETIKSLNDEELKFHTLVTSEIRNINTNVEIKIKRLANHTLVYMVNDHEIGRVKLRGKLSILLYTLSDSTWITLPCFDDANNYVGHWVKYARNHIG